MRTKFGVAVVTAALALTLGAAPALAAQPQFGCFTQGGSLLFLLGTPGDDNWVSNVADCIAIDKIVAHPQPWSG